MSLQPLCRNAKFYTSSEVFVLVYLTYLVPTISFVNIGRKIIRAQTQAPIFMYVFKFEMRQSAMLEDLCSGKTAYSLEASDTVEIIAKVNSI